MKLSLRANALKKAVQAAMQAVPSNPILPTLESVKLDFSSSEVKVSGTNLEFYITATLEVDEAERESISVCVNGKSLLKAVTTYAKHSDTIEISYDPESDGFSIYAEGVGEVSFTTYKVDEFPPRREYVPKGGFVTSRYALNNLHEAHEAVKTSVSKEEARPVLNNVYFEVLKHTTQITSADGFTASRWKFQHTPIFAGKEEFSFLILERSLNKAMKALSKKARILVAYDPKIRTAWLLQDFDGQDIRSPKIEIAFSVEEGRFPDVDQIFDSAKDQVIGKVEFSIEAFLDKLTLLREISDGKFASVLTGKDETLLLSDSSEDDPDVKAQLELEATFSFAHEEDEEELSSVSYKAGFTIAYLERLLKPCRKAKTPLVMELRGSVTRRGINAPLNLFFSEHHRAIIMPVAQ